MSFSSWTLDLLTPTFALKDIKLWLSNARIFAKDVFYNGKDDKRYLIGRVASRLGYICIRRTYAGQPFLYEELMAAAQRVRLHCDCALDVVTERDSDNGGQMHAKANTTASQLQPQHLRLYEGVMTTPFDELSDGLTVDMTQQSLKQNFEAGVDTAPPGVVFVHNACRPGKCTMGPIYFQ
jgi:hypothetical protein